MMTALYLLGTAFLGPSSGSFAALPAPLRVIDKPGMHVGLRPAVYLEQRGLGFGMTLQVTAFPVTM